MILANMDLLNITFAYVIQAIAVVIILWEAGKKIMEIKEKSDLDHDRKQRWDKAADIVEKKEKVWDDADNQDGIRPDSVTVRLWNGDEEVATTTATAASGWAYLIIG